ncbi:MAG: ModD protein [Verrucomicrobia bacterium Tous-C9LFEB]|nr:MAG: ModD protein [Verrucomicrobia bacterium Tous-C9LFEB]
MFTIGDDTLERWLREDAPYGDLTTATLGLRGQPGRIRFHSRESLVLCGTEEVRRIFEKLGIVTRTLRLSGESAGAGDLLLEATGPVEALHLGWKLSVNILEHASGIATRTRQLVDLAKEVNPKVEVVTTRKGFPGTRELAIKAVLAGGGKPHRLGLSETFLAFRQHRAFFVDTKTFLAGIPEWKEQICEKKLIVETDSVSEALELADAGVDGIQFDKIEASELAHAVALLRVRRPSLLLIAAGGIHRENVAAYAATGVNALATSAAYFGKPSDIGVTMESE